METKYNVEYLKIPVYIDIWGFREPFLRTQKRKKKKKKKKIRAQLIFVDCYCVKITSAQNLEKVRSFSDQKTFLQVIPNLCTQSASPIPSYYHVPSPTKTLFTQYQIV